LIVLDTHVWSWWVHCPERLTDAQQSVLTAAEADVIGVSAISCWEAAKLVERGRLELPVSLERWFPLAFAYPGVALLPLTPEIALASTRLPGSFHRDPADQLIVATARVLKCPLLTSDTRILAYEHVRTIS